MTSSVTAPTRSRRTLIWAVVVIAILAVFSLVGSGSAVAAVSESSTGATLVPWIQSDQADYTPGSTVTLTGGNWAPGESVHLFVDDTTNHSWNHSVDVVADDSGTIQDVFSLPNVFVSDYDVTATGAASGVATATFTDANVANLAGPTSPSNSSSAVFTWTVQGGGTTTTECSRDGAAFAACVSGISYSGLADGSHAFSVKITGANNNTASTWPWTIDTVAPARPSVIGTTPASPSSNNNPTVNGTAEAGSTVKVYTNSSCTSSLAGSGTATGGSFAIGVTVPINSSTTFWATATDAAGNPSPCSSTSVTYVEDSSAPALPTFMGTTPASPGSSTTPTVDGNAETSSTVRIYTNATCTNPVAGTGTAAATGQGKFSVLVTVATGSTTTFWATATDAAGNTSGCSTANTTYTQQTIQTTAMTTAAASGAFGGTANLSAILKVGINGVSGKTVSFTLNGNAAGTAVTDASGVASLTAVSLSGINAGTYASGVSASFAGDASFSASSGTNSLTVNQASQTISFAVLADKTYGDSSFTVSATGGPSGNAVTFSVGATDNCTSGGTNGATITITGAGSCTVTAHQAGNTNYSAATGVPQTFSIGRAPLSATADDDTKVYGAANPSPLTGTLTGVKNGDPVTASYSSSATVLSGVGGYPIVPQINATAAVLANYQAVPTLTNGTLSVTRAPLSATADDDTKVYGAANPSPLTGTLTGVKNGDPVTASYSSSATVLSGVGGYPIVPQINATAAVLANYQAVPTLTNGTLSVTRAPLSATADDDTKVYGAANPSPLTGTLTGVKNGDPVTASYSSSATVLSGVGGYPIVPQINATAAVLANYQAVPTLTNGTLSVTRAPLSATADDDTKVYGAANPSPLTGTLTGVKNGDPVTASYSSSATVLSGVGGYPIVPQINATAAVLANYQAVPTLTNGTLSVTRAPLSATADDDTKVYGAANPSPLTGTLTGVKNGDPVTASYSSSATVLSGVGGYPIVPQINATAAVLANYQAVPTLTNGTLSVTRAPLSATADDDTKVYGAANPSPLTGTLTGVKNGDPVTASYSSSATVLSGVGGYPIVPQINATAAVLANYQAVPTLTNGTLSVTRAPLSATADDDTKVYGAANPSPLTGTLTGVKNGDPVTASYSSSATVLSGVGGYPIVPQINATAAVLANYQAVPTLTNGTLSVTRAPLSATADDDTKVYGAANPSPLTGTLTGVKNGDPVTASYSSSATVLSGVGGYPIVPQINATAAVLANYQAVPTLTNGTLSVTRAPLSATADDDTKVYGAANPSPLTGTLTGVKNGDPVTASYSSSATVLSGVGGYPIVPQINATAAVLANYQAVPTLTNGTLSVTRAPLSATADDDTKVYGAANPSPLTGTLTGVKNGDPVTASYSSSATVLSGVGGYPIVPQINATAAVLANYQAVPTLTNGTLSVTRAPLSATADDDTKVYGAANPSPLTGTLTGVKNGDPVTASYSSSATVLSGVGGYPIVPQINATAAVLANYQAVPTLTNGTLSVTRAPLSATADDDTKVYGAANPSPLTGTLTGVKNGDPVTASYSSSATVLSGVGGYPIVPQINATAAVLANYQAVPTLTNGTLSVTRAPLSATADDDTKVYGAANPSPLTGTLTGVKNGDPVTASYSSSATVLSGVGGYPIVPQINATAAVLANYQAVPTLTNGTLSVTRAPLSATADDDTKVYGAANPSPLTGTLTGVKNGDPVTASYSSSATVLSGVGGYPIVPQINATAAVLANYQAVPTLTNGTLSVTRAPLSATADDDTKVYGAANPSPLTGTLTGVKNGDPVTASYSSSATVLSGVGGYPIVPQINATAAVLANYQAVPTLTNGTLSVTRAPLSATADDDTKVYGAANPSPLTGTLTGVKNGDPVTASYSSSATVLSGVGGYPIVPQINATAAVLANYQAVPTLTNGTLSVTRAPLSATADNKAKVLNAVTPALTGSLAGVKNGDSVTVSFSTTAVQASPVGPYPIVPQINATAAVLANYQAVPTLTNGTLTISYAAGGTCNGEAGHSILQPVNADWTVNLSVFKQGSTVPSKFRVCDANGVSMGTAGLVTNFALVQKLSLAANEVVDETVYSTTPDTAFRWDSTAQQWIFNISTKTLKAGTTYVYQVTLNDGSKIDFRFGLK